MSPIDNSRYSAFLLTWYDRQRRDLPWRAAPGQTSDPYRVWLSEIMLQQTTVATVSAYYDRFVARWPTVVDLAAAELDEILHAWQGLGYYARARNLHKCAYMVANRYNGVFPNTEDGLRGLPGVGPYTAAAVAAIAFDEPTSPVDGNIERVVARLFRIDVPLPKGKVAIAKKAATLTPAQRPGDFAQAMMDLGAMICTPKAPKCSECPWSNDCEGKRFGDAETYPRRTPKKVKPTRQGVVFWIADEQGRVLLRRRSENGLLGGMVEFPATPWDDKAGELEFARVLAGQTNAGGILDKISKDIASTHAPLDAAPWTLVDGDIRHTFTHFHLRLWVFKGQCGGANENLGTWVLPGNFGDFALPTVTKKVVKLVLAETD